MPPDPADLWAFLPLGYAASVAIEVPVLLAGLSRRHSLGTRFIAGLWLTACTYPIVVLVLPLLVWEPLGRTAYLAVAEIFAPLAEGALFYFAYDRDSPRRDQVRNFAVIVAANLASFLAAETWFHWTG